MVCIGRKAQVLARRGMDIRRGNHPSRRRAFSAVLTRVAYTSPRAQRVNVLIPTAVLHVVQKWLRNPRSSSFGPHRRELRLVSRSSAPGSPPRWLCPPPPSPPSPPASLRESPTHPGYSRPVPHRSSSRSHPLFFHGLRLGLPQFLHGKPVRQCRQHLRPGSS